MAVVSIQPGLFDSDQRVDDMEAASARARMREMIDRLGAAITPPWKDEMAVILEDGSFKRAMRLVPEQEARALWAEFDALKGRLYAVWIEGRPSLER